MVNHYRTLLLNLPAQTTEGPGEEYIPTDFQPLTLPESLQTIRGLLLGDANRTESNYRLRQLLTILHISDWRPYLYVPDARITYWPFSSAWPIESIPNLADTAVSTFGQVRGALAHALFGTAEQEPWKTFQALWLDQPVVTDRLAGLTLALAYRLDEASHAA